MRGCVVIFCLLLLFPKLSVSAVLIVPVICGCRNAPLHVCLDFYLSTRLHPVKDAHARTGRVCVCVFTGKLNVSARAHHSAVNIRPSLLPLSLSLCSRGMGSTNRAASILSLPREIRHEIKARIKGQGRNCHLIQHYLYSHDDDVYIALMITGQAEERDMEKASLSPPSAVPLTCHHLCCQGPSARLAPA